MIKQCRGSKLKPNTKTIRIPCGQLVVAEIRLPSNPELPNTTFEFDPPMYVCKGHLEENSEKNPDDIVLYLKLVKP